MIPTTLASTGNEEAQVVSLLVILAVAAAVTMVLRRFRLSTIPGYVIAGALVGPHALALIGDPESVKLISGVAILLLMFTIGLHLDIGSIRVGLRQILLLGALTTLASTLVGWAAAIIAGLSPPIALTIAMAFSMSSTAVGLRLLQQRRQIHSMHGRIAFGILIVQDMLALVVLGVLPLVAAWAGVRPQTPTPDAVADAAAPAPLRMLLHAATALGGIALLIALGRRLLPRLLREAAKDSSSETLLVLSAAVALGAAALTRYLGFSPELGAFLAGFLLAATPFKYQLSGQLAPMRDLFMAVFFTTVGLQLDGRELLRNWEIILLGLPALLIAKGLIIGVGSWLSGATPATSFMTGVGLSQASEFSLVVLAVAGGAGGLGIVDDTLMGQAVALVVLSLALAPTLYELAERWQGRFAKLPTAKWMKNSPLSGEGTASGHAAPGARHIIIAGFGVVGRNLAEHFGAAGLPFTIVELNPTTVSRQRKLGRSIIFGDVANPEVLETAGIHCAEAVILTIPDDEATLRACRSIRQMAPKVFIAARTANLSRAIVATDLGADHVTVEEVATAQEMARQVMSRLESRRAASEAAATEPAPPAAIAHEDAGESAA